MLAEFPADERHERGAALIDVMTLVVTQMLLPNPQGGRTPSSDHTPAVGHTACRLAAPLRVGAPLPVAAPLQEAAPQSGNGWASTAPWKAALLEAPQERWPALIGRALERTGNGLAAAAERAFRRGLIGEADWRRVVAGAGAGCAAEPGRSGRNRE